MNTFTNVVWALYLIAFVFNFLGLAVLDFPMTIKRTRAHYAIGTVAAGFMLIWCSVVKGFF